MKKRSSITSTFLFILLVGACITAFSLWQDAKSLKSENKRLRSTQVETANTIVEKYVDRVDTVQHTIFKDRIVTRSDLKKGQVPINKGLLDTMVLALKMADGNEAKFNKQIKDLTRINGRLEGVIEGLKGDIEKGVLIDFNSQYLNASVDTLYKMTYGYDAELRIATYDEPGGFLGLGNPKHYIDISSPDTNFTINSIDRFRVEVPVKPKPWGIGIIGGWTIDPTIQNGELKFRPSLGVGVSYNVIRF
ncbi:hypothetical protein [Albibacterium profundi]|uniref:Uncharacterized protein n=1 Tax=Albibacterium profundi TaxID=3134906 RepID=A0ABV5CFH3_9SPHI